MATLLATVSFRLATVACNIADSCHDNTCNMSCRVATPPRLTTLMSCHVSPMSCHVLMSCHVSCVDELSCVADEFSCVADELSVMCRR
jgi:hypothetical protein